MIALSANFPSVDAESCEGLQGPIAQHLKLLVLLSLAWSKDSASGAPDDLGQLLYPTEQALLTFTDLLAADSLLNPYVDLD